MLIPGLGDTDRGRILGMPAHKTKTHPRKVPLSSASLLTEEDLDGNDASDTYDKEVVEAHRVSKGDVKA